MMPKQEGVLARMSKEDLVKILDETERQIDDIRAELDARELPAQHQAIDEVELPEPLTVVDWDAVWQFFRHVLEDLRKNKAG